MRSRLSRAAGRRRLGIRQFRRQAETGPAGDGGTVFHEPTPGTLPDGSAHSAFLQSPGSTISQNVVLPSDGIYELSYYVAGRYSSDPNGGTLLYQVKLDADIIGKEWTSDYQPWIFKSYLFTATAGDHLLEFEGLEVPPDRAFDQTALFDKVGLTLVPEPHGFALGVGVGLLVFASLRRNRRSFLETVAAVSRTSDRQMLG